MLIGNACQIVVDTITQSLYPEEKYPKNLFPDIYPLLLDCFLKAVGPQPELKQMYRDCRDREKLTALTREILAFPCLLKNHPGVVVLIYCSYIEKFIYYKHGSQSDRADIAQEVITRLMEDKIYKIRDKFQFDSQKGSTFTSYLMVSVRNTYIDIIRERSIRPLTTGECRPFDETFGGKEDDNMFGRLLIEEELLKLSTIIKMYHKSRAKLELCLKLKHRLKIEKSDVRRCFPNCSESDLSALTRDFTLEKDNTMFENVCKVFNVHEKKQSKSDTIRKWIFVKLDEIVSHLNRTHKKDVYNRKNIGDLVSLYFNSQVYNDSSLVKN